MVNCCRCISRNLKAERKGIICALNLTLGSCLIFYGKCETRGPPFLELRLRWQAHFCSGPSCQFPSQSTFAFEIGKEGTLWYMFVKPGVLYLGVRVSHLP